MERKSQGLSYLCCLEPPSTTDNQELRNQGPGFHSIQWLTLTLSLPLPPSRHTALPSVCSTFCLFLLFISQLAKNKDRIK